MPTLDQTIILRIFAGLKAAPGQPVPLTTLLLNWPPSRGNTAFADAVEGLAADGTLTANPTGTAFALTLSAAQQGAGGGTTGHP